MTIYAVFLCFAVSGQCQMFEPGRQTFAGYMPGITYPTLEACQDKIKVYAPYPRKDITFRCFGRHVDTWEPQQ
jgi:hypothetical protein